MKYKLYGKIITRQLSFSNYSGIDFSADVESIYEQIINVPNASLNMIEYNIIKTENSGTELLKEFDSERQLHTNDGIFFGGKVYRINKTIYNIENDNTLLLISLDKYAQQPKLELMIKKIEKVNTMLKEYNESLKVMEALENSVNVINDDDDWTLY